MLVHILILIIGFFFLIKGAGLLVEGSTSLAVKFKIPQTVIGLTIVALGTSLPELFINLFGNYYSLPDLGLGNIVGSSMALMLLIVGICATIYPIKINKQILRKELPLVAFAVIIFILLANNLFLDSTSLFIGRIDGLILLVLFLIFIYSTIGKSKKIALIGHKTRNLKSSLALIAIGITGLIIGGNFVLLSSYKIANLLEISSAVIGLSLLAIGTTLPELITSIVATRKKNADLAIGNIIGSIAFNILFIIGLTSIIKPIPYNPIFNSGLSLIIISIIIFYYFVFNKNRDRKIQRWEGAILIILYFSYLGFTFF